MRLSHYFLGLPVCCLLLAGCSSTPEAPTSIISKFHGVLPEILVSDSGLFHGVMLGMTEAEVKKYATPKDSLSLEQGQTLLFEGKTAPNKEYTYECNFDEKGLHTVTLEIFLKDEQNGDSLLADFRNYFSLKYGGPAETDDTYTWTVDQGKRPAKIQLSEDPEYAYGKLTIVFFDKTFDLLPPGMDSLGAPTGDSLILP